MSDDVSMGALSGTIGERSRAAIAAGCDVVLHCNGDLAEMEAVAADAPSLSESGARRLRNALVSVAGRDLPDVESARRELDKILTKIIV
jgi:beta-N-acetylhexosaminidase